MCPTSSMGYGVLALLLSSSGAQSSEGSLQVVSSSVEPLGVQPFPTWGAFSFIVQGGPPIYIYLALCLDPVWESFILVSRRGPLGQSGVGRLESGWFSWATGCPSAVPSSTSRDSLVTRMVARESSPVLFSESTPLICRATSPHPCVDPARRAARPVRGALPRSGERRPVTLAGVMEWCAGATIITARKGTSVDALSRSVAGPALAALSLCQRAL